MTNNTDEFDQDQFDPMDNSLEDEASYAEPKQSFVDKLRNSPILKLAVIVGVVGVALAGALGAFSGKETVNVSRVASVPSISEPPGGASSQFFIDQNKMANEQRATEALQTGGSAMPTPRGRDVSELAPPKDDPMQEFREETERLRKELRAEQEQSTNQVKLLQKQVTQQQQEPFDDNLAQAMQSQMQELMASWKPSAGRIVKGVVEPTKRLETQEIIAQRMAAQKFVAPVDNAAPDVLLTAGTVNYMQLLTEANSDVPGPILAQILSGPFAGGRAIGAFQVVNDYLVMTFSSISYKGDNYPVQGMALDPNTTLGGMATEVDHRYFIRILLPAAGSFMAAFGDALSDTDVTTTVSDGTVLQDQAKKGYKEAIYAGLGSVGETVSEFFKAEANRTKTLVRVAVGTPMGIFFLKDVTELAKQQPLNSNVSSSGNNPALLRGYQNVLGMNNTAEPVAKTTYDMKSSSNTGPLLEDQKKLLKSLTLR